LLKIESKRLLYRKFTQEDFEDLHEILSNPAVCKFLPGNDNMSKEAIQKWHSMFMKSFLDEHHSSIFAILKKGSKKVIGYGGLGYVKEFDKIEIMYGFNQSVWGKGYATETSLRMKELAIELGMKDLIALADIRNIPSQKILIKTGFKETDRIHIWGIDCVHYEIKL